MDSLADLMNALTASQQVKASTKLSDRNVVELVNKLKQVTCSIASSEVSIGPLTFCHALSSAY